MIAKDEAEGPSDSSHLPYLRYLAPLLAGLTRLARLAYTGWLTGGLNVLLS